MASGEIFVNKETFEKDAETIRAEADEAKTLTLPEVSGSGYTIDKLDEMVLTMHELHTKALALILASADMLQKMGYEFKELDEVTAKICKNIE